MSSILDALKKLETESGRQLGTDDANAFNPRQALQRQLKTRPRIRAWMLVLPVCSLLLITGWLWYTRQPASRPVASPAVAPVVAKTQTPAKIARPAPPATLAKPTLPSRIQRPRPRPEPVVNASPRPESSPPFTAEQVAPDRKRADDTVSQPADNRRPVVSELAPFPQDGGLTLQALAWAPSPESRFAVINTRIVREGQRIEAVTVVRIEPEQVVLRQAGKLWQLRHRP